MPLAVGVPVSAGEATLAFSGSLARDPPTMIQLPAETQRKLNTSFAAVAMFAAPGSSSAAECYRVSAPEKLTSR